MENTINSINNLFQQEKFSGYWTNYLINSLDIDGEFNKVKLSFENKDNVDIITYENTRHFSLLNVSVLERDTDGKYFYQFSINFI